MMVTAAKEQTPFAADDEGGSDRLPGQDSNL